MVASRPEYNFCCKAQQVYIFCISRAGDMQPTIEVTELETKEEDVDLAEWRNPILSPFHRNLEEDEEGTSSAEINRTASVEEAPSASGAAPLPSPGGTMRNRKSTVVVGPTATKKGHESMDFEEAESMSWRSVRKLHAVLYLYLRLLHLLASIPSLLPRQRKALVQFSNNNRLEVGAFGHTGSSDRMLRRFGKDFVRRINGLEISICERTD